MKHTIWVSWENHRRTVELAKTFEIPLIIIKAKLPMLVKHAYKSWITYKIIQKHKPRVLIVQNPSIVLAFVASVLRLLFRYKLVVDRHTNFRIGKKIGLNPLTIGYTFISLFSIKYSNLTIITNEYLKTFVENRGGRGFVLPDKLPYIKNDAYTFPLKGENNVAFICTYAKDEPYRNVIKAAELIPNSIYIYVTGRARKEILRSKIPKNLIITGFLPKKEYEKLLSSVDIIIDFTNLEWCLVCGGYEAVSIEKPIITSDTIALKSFFKDAAIYSGHKPIEIASAIKKAITQKEECTKKVRRFKIKYNITWEKEFNKLKELINDL